MQEAAKTYLLLIFTHSLSMKTSTLVEANHLEVSQVFDNMI